ncbi:peptidase S41 [Azospirillum thermophilum]|uniref:Peptidase S41 n=2 Tax=Azospirillum thermophilum TaxID=2202148 RepID=A0A2S2CU33_9PROT|nr:peptidase S41 [Azospirillum thermophilum]
MSDRHASLRAALRRCVAAPLAVAFLAFGTASGEPSRAFAAAPSFVSEQVFSVGFGKIAEVYLLPVAIDQLALDGLKGLTGIDPSVKVERDGSTVRLYVSGTLTAEFGAAAGNDPGAWAALTTRVIDRARLYAPVLGQATPERIYQVVFDGVTSGLDGYSRYTGLQRATTERAQREGYGGIGISLEIVNGRTLIRDVLPRGPADRSGVRDGDQLLAIDGDLTTRLGEGEMRDRLRGPTGSVVTVTLARDGSAPRRIPVRRERVVPGTVSASAVDQVGVLKVDRFNATTASTLRDSVASLRQGAGKAGLRGYVLDLRGNPGGLLDQAVAVADLFMRRGRIISTEGRHPDSRQRIEATPDDIIDGQPLVVLVDGRSASSAEVVAAALQDSGRAVVVGASSYGKGSVQTVTRLPNDGELFLTWSRIYTPAGYTLHRQGVQPTICTSRAGQEDAAALLSDLRNGRAISMSQLVGWRARAADDEQALARLRETCPWKEHEPELDLKVALMLLAEPGLYQRAAALSVVNTVAER